MRALRRVLARAVSCSFIVACAALVPMFGDDAAGQSNSCEGRVSGVEHPYLIPSQVLWEAILDAAASAGADNRLAELSLELGIGSATADRLSREGISMRERLKAIRAVQPALQSNASASIEREIASSDAILETRDDLLRSVPDEEVEHLQSAAVAKRRTYTYTFQIAGSSVNRPGACVVEIIGRDRPDLIPEAYAWEAYLRTYGDVAQRLRRQEGYSSEGLLAIQQHHLPISVSDIGFLLDIASGAATEIERRRRGAPNDLESDVAQIVENARIRLLRRLTRSSWKLVVSDAKRARTGSVYVYPPSL